MSTEFFPELAERVHRQCADIPELYSDIDRDTCPERFTIDPNVQSALPSDRGDRVRYLEDARLVELCRIATFLGDVRADRVALLSSELRVSELIEMVRTACRCGVDAVPDAPQPLRELIEHMESTPEWIDTSLVAQGAAHARVSAGLIAPFVTRGAFIATFTNRYAALPMTITGALSGTRAAHRVNETTAFFAVTTLPGALDRFGAGFEAAAMVRLMHSMVRFNALCRSTRWSVDVYGVPVPQIDQLPAGMIAPYLAALRVLRSGRTEFDRSDRAMVEFCRYRCYLLGLPEELLPVTPQGIVDMFYARAATLRAGFDDDCRRLVESTMDAYLRPSETLLDRAADAVEKSYSKLAFCRAFSNGQSRKARHMGVAVGVADYARIALTAPFIAGRVLVVMVALRVPVLRGSLNRYLVRSVERRLDTYGVPAYTTDLRDYSDR